MVRPCTAPSSGDNDVYLLLLALSFNFNKLVISGLGLGPSPELHGHLGAYTHARFMFGTVLQLIGTYLN